MRFAAMQIIDTQQLSQATGKAQRTIQLWQQQGKLPQPLPVKNRTIWPAQTIRDWLIVHMPDADLTALEGV
jgi:predicted DNA-binding transcriptional regulator AlpA